MKIGHKILYHANVSSTNDLATEMLNRGRAQDGCIISAGFQLAGKGQRNNKWHSDAFMNLIMSVILIPKNIRPEQQFYISKIVSLSILETISGYSDLFSIKWPNDIYHGGDKIAGILIEHTITGNNISASIAGIGLNINQKEFPAEVANPISLSIISGQSHNVQDLQDNLCINMQKWYTSLKKNELESIDRIYKENLYRRGVKSQFESQDGIFSGTVLGVNDFGQLIILTEDGDERLFSFKEVEFISSDDPNR